jgi:hypothetical protein
LILPCLFSDDHPYPSPQKKSGFPALTESI